MLLTEEIWKNIKWEDHRDRVRLKKMIIYTKKLKGTNGADAKGLLKSGCRNTKR